MRMNRRTFVALAATSTLAAPFVRPSWAATTVTLAGYGGVFRDNYQKSVIDPFQTANPDIAVEYYQMNNSAQNLGTLRGQQAAPQIDLSILDVTVAKIGTDEQIFAPVTASDVPAIADLYPQAVVKGVAGPGVTFDSVEIIYSPERIAKAPVSWAGLADPAYARQVAFAGVPGLEAIAMLFLMSGQKGGITDYKAAVDAGFTAMQKIAPNVLSWDPRPDAAGFVLSGAAGIGVTWNARGQSYLDQSGGKLKIADATEGTALQLNTINLVKGAPNREAALKFMQYALGAEAQKTFTEAMFYAPVNAKADISPAALARTVAAPERMSRVLNVDWITVAGIREGIIQDWRRRILAQ